MPPSCDEGGTRVRVVAPSAFECAPAYLGTPTAAQWFPTLAKPARVDHPQEARPRPAIEKLLRDTRLDDRLKTFGL